jgi:hypothetical protein
LGKISVRSGYSNDTDGSPTSSILDCIDGADGHDGGHGGGSDGAGH